LEEVLNLIGTNRKTMYDWNKQYANHSTKKKVKYRVLMKAKSVFKLSVAEAENLANKAGISLIYINRNNKIDANKEEFSAEIFSYDDTEDRLVGYQQQVKNEFAEHLNNLVTLSGRKLIDLCHDASISESMLRHMRKGKHLEKEAIIALLIVLEQDLEQIQMILKKAGYILSFSLPSDVVIMWLLEDKVCFSDGVAALLKINNVLDELGLPLLMTRPRA